METARGLECNDLLLDSGATFHFSGEIGKGGVLLAPSVDVKTAEGIATFDKGITSMENQQIGYLVAKYAPGAPRAAVDSLCAPTSANDRMGASPEKA